MGCYIEAIPEFFLLVCKFQHAMLWFNDGLAYFLYFLTKISFCFNEILSYHPLTK